MAKSGRRRSSRSRTRSTAQREPVRTIVYVHGIGQSTDASTLKSDYDQALLGNDVGERSLLAYWADLVNADLEAPSAAALDEWDVAWRSPGWAAGEGAPTKKAMEKLARELDEASEEAIQLAETEEENVGGLGPEAQLIGPEPVRRAIMKRLTRTFLREVHAYLFNHELRDAMRGRLRDLLVEGGGPYMVIGHSLGSVIAYDVLHEIEEDVAVPVFVTIGSPLGLQNVRDHVTMPWKVPPPVDQWRNFHDRLDPVSLRSILARVYQPRSRISDDHVRNPHRWRWPPNPHAALGFLEHPKVRDTVLTEVGSSFTDHTARFVVSRDVAASIAGPPRRHPILIELDDSVEGESLDEKREGVAAMVASLVAESAERERRVAQDQSPDEMARTVAKLDRLRRYIAAELTPREIVTIRARHADLRISHVWANSRKEALLDVSGNRLQAFTAQRGYQATGRGIAWAILDTGISLTEGAAEAYHPHFARHRNIAAHWDCSRPGPPTEGAGVDRNGHGTHVAGIIAGEEHTPPHPHERAPYVGMAPEAKLHIYKVLGDRGEGQDSWIIKALDHIARINEQSADLAIHGVNLSLGGAFDYRVFGCGHSPLCRELRRLWRMGVIVCIAAGNEGRVSVEAGRREREINLAQSIGDPGNLEDAIVVGSVHKEQPHQYGVSWFSSRGPTADGRVKPDVVAPGERIVSCSSVVDSNDATTHYREASGTSMACPHVSGILAAFLSVRREFIGHPDRVKDMLLSNATDLGRSRYHQGAGLPNLIHMLSGT